MREAAVRELKEETSLEVEKSDLELLGNFTIVKKNERHIVDVVFEVGFEKTEGEPSAGEDAEKARFMAPGEVDNKSLLFEEMEKEDIFE